MANLLAAQFGAGSAGGTGGDGVGAAGTGDAGGTARADALRVLDAVAARAATQAQDENFPVALRLLPRTARDQLTRVYAFARFVDDVGDEAPGERAELLAVVRAELARGAESELAPVRGLGPVFAAGVPLAPFADLVAANVVDQQVTRYETFDDLLGYCTLSAAPVGRIVLALADAATPDNLAASDAVCNALQILEHCQDVREDAAAGRVYLPAGLLRAAGLDDADLPDALTGTATPAAVRSVVADQVGRARQLLRHGVPLVGNLSGWARFAVAGFLAGGLATADALALEHFDVCGRDLRPTRRGTLAHAGRLLLGRRR